MKKRILIVIAVLLFVVFAGCEKKDRCLKSHTEKRVGTYCFSVGKMLICNPTIYDVVICDEYEHGDFICTRKINEEKSSE